MYINRLPSTCTGPEQKQSTRGCYVLQIEFCFIIQCQGERRKQNLLLVAGMAHWHHSPRNIELRSRSWCNYIGYNEARVSGDPRADDYLRCSDQPLIRAGARAAGSNQKIALHSDHITERGFTITENTLRHYTHVNIDMWTCLILSLKEFFLAFIHSYQITVALQLLRCNTFNH